MRSPFTDGALQTGKAGIIQITALWMNSEVKLKTRLIADELSVSVGWSTQQMSRQITFSCFDDNTDTLFVASYGRKLTLKWRTAAQTKYGQKTVSKCRKVSYQKQGLRFNAVLHREKKFNISPSKESLVRFTVTTTSILRGKGQPADFISPTSAPNWLRHRGVVKKS